MDIMEFAINEVVKVVNNCVNATIKDIMAGKYNDEDKITSHFLEKIANSINGLPKMKTLDDEKLLEFLADYKQYSANEESESGIDFLLIIGFKLKGLK